MSDDEVIRLVEANERPSPILVEFIQWLMASMHCTERSDPSWYLGMPFGEHGGCRFYARYDERGSRVVCFVDEQGRDFGLRSVTDTFEELRAALRGVIDRREARRG